MEMEGKGMVAANGGNKKVVELNLRANINQEKE
jgi:hypothetical protein